MKALLSIIMAGSIVLDPSSVQAQQPLQPLWQHVWNFGQDDIMFVVPAGRDNHVVVDPVTGLIHCTVDDQLSAYSDRGELIFTFDPDGADLTTSPPPVVGFNSSEIDPLYNGLGTMDISVYNGKASATQFRRDSITYNFKNHVVSDGPDGTPWVTSYHRGAPGPNGFQSVATDGQYVVLAGPPLVVFDHYGWYQWQSDQGGTRAFIHNGIVYTASEGEVRRFQLEDGTPLSPFQGTIYGFVAMAFNDENMYWAEMVSGSLQATALSLEGDLVWEIPIQVAASYSVRTITLDANGRLWCVLNSYDENVSDIVVRIEIDGSASISYSYGYRINDIATDGDHIYLTGQLDQNTSETFLIAVNASLPTAIVNEAEQETLLLWPNPAKDILHVSGGGVNWSHATIHDVQGRIIRSMSKVDLSAIDVHDLEQGAYFLSLNGSSKAERLPFMITR